MQLGAEHMRARLETVFREIETSRMDGVPILNKDLSVAALGFEPYQDYHLGVLLTPWFMNLMLMPLDPEKYTENPPQVGGKQMITVPAGQVEFIVGFEESLGYCLSCSLFSPVFEFENQQAAIETAAAALEQVLNDACATDEDEAERQGAAPDAPERPRLPPRDVSRRDFLRGGAAPTAATGGGRT